MTTQLPRRRRGIIYRERSRRGTKNFRESQGAPFAAKTHNGKGGDHMADLLHGLIEVLTTPLFAVMILAGIAVGKLTKHR